MSKRGGFGYNRKLPMTPDPHGGNTDKISSTSRLHMRQCNFWKFGKCNWGWSCRYLHGNSLQDDPRRPEYRGNAVDFTVFPRPVQMSPRFFGTYGNNIHVEDATKLIQLRNPVVDVVCIDDSDCELVGTIKELLIKNGIDVLINDKNKMSRDEIKQRVEDEIADYVVLAGAISIIIFPQGINIEKGKLPDYIMKNWETRNNNLTPNQIELLTRAEIEKILSKLINMQNILSTIYEFQDKVSEAMASMESEDCKITQQKLEDYRYEILLFFGKLNQGNSIISDSLIYSNEKVKKDGAYVQILPQCTFGISLALQKVLSLFIANSLTQIHICLCHINQMTNKYVPKPNNFASPKPTTMYQSPFCFMECSSLLADENNSNQQKMIDSDDVKSNYSVSFRYGYYG